MRDHLERAGFPCWMDIGQMGGGDALYAKIYEGIRNAKVCSWVCQRERNLHTHLLGCYQWLLLSKPARLLSELDG